MARLKTAILSEMNVLKVTLAKHNDGGNVSWKAMGRGLERLIKDWGKVEQLYQNVIALADRIEVEADKQAHMRFQLDLFTLHDQIQNIVDAGRETSENQKAKASKALRRALGIQYPKTRFTKDRS